MSAALDWHEDGADWPRRETSRFIKTDAMTWHVQIAGQGPTLLLLHGTGASSHSYRHLAPLLEKDFRLVIPDLPGHGFSEALPGPAQSLPGMAQALRSLLQKLDTQIDLAIGHSAGGAIAIRMCLDGMINPRAVVGINAALTPYGGIANQTFPGLARVFMLNPLVLRFFSWQASGLGAVRSLMQSTGSRLSEEDLKLYQKLFLSQRHLHATVAMMANWNLTKLKQEMSGLKTPLVLIVAKGDLAVSPEDARRVKQTLPATQLHFLPNCGHLCHEEKPQEVADIIKQIAHDQGVLHAA